MASRLVQWLLGKPRLVARLFGRNRLRVRDNSKLYVRVSKRWVLLPVRVKVHPFPEDFQSDNPPRASR